MHPRRLPHLPDLTCAASCFGARQCPDGLLGGSVNAAQLCGLVWPSLVLVCLYQTEQPSRSMLQTVRTVAEHAHCWYRNE